MNDAACALFGRGEAALLAMAVEQVTDPVVAHGVREVWRRFLAPGTCPTYEIARADGQLCLVDFQAVANTPLPGHHVSRMTLSNVCLRADPAPDRPLVRKIPRPAEGQLGAPSSVDRRRRRELRPPELRAPAGVSAPNAARPRSAARGPCLRPAITRPGRPANPV